MTELSYERMCHGSSRLKRPRGSSDIHQPGAARGDVAWRKGFSDGLSGRIERRARGVEHQQQLFPARRGPHPSLVTEVNCREHGAGHEGSIANLDELDDPGAGAKIRVKVGCGPQCEPGRVAPGLSSRV